MSDDRHRVEALRLDEQVGRLEWPAPGVIDVPAVQRGDCLIVCAGFEERSVEALRRLHEQEMEGIAVVLITYRPRYPENREKNIRQMAQRATISTIVYDRKAPAGVGAKVSEAVTGNNRIFVDISGMSRLLIVQIVVALLCETTDVPVTLLYSEADTYSPTKTEVGRRGSVFDVSPSYISSGIFEIAADPALSSVSMLGAEIRLVAFPSFDHIQLKNLVEELQPTHADIVYGVRSAPANMWRKEAIRDLNSSIVKGLRSRRTHESSTLDYRETIMLLLDIYKERSMFDRIVVAPTGSKMQAVAVGLFRAALYDVQVVYPTPRVFIQPQNYTEGVRRLYAVDIPVREFTRIVGGGDWKDLGV